VRLLGADRIEDTVSPILLSRPQRGVYRLSHKNGSSCIVACIRGRENSSIVRETAHMSHYQWINNTDTHFVPYVSSTDRFLFSLASWEGEPSTLTPSRLPYQKVKAKLSLQQAVEGPQGFETLRLQHFLDIRFTDGGEVASLTPRPPCTPRKIPGTHFC
jgi:hypothetical protein